ncbi:MAG: WD40 repeat domain-containing protein [Candidatus Thorarchaeota archaeon]
MEKDYLFRPVGKAPAPLSSIAIAPKGRLLASGTRAGNILLIDSKSGKSKRGITGHGGSVSEVSFTDKSTSIVSCSWDKTTRLWNIKSREEPTILKHASEVKSLTTSISSGKGASGSRDGEIKLFSLTSLKCTKNLQAHSSDISGITLIEDGTKMVTSSYDGECKLWDLSSYENIKSLTKKGPRLRSLTSTPDGSFVFLGHNDGRIIKISLENIKDKHEMLGHSDIVSTMAVDPSGTFLASGSWDRTLRIWSLEDGQEIASGQLVTGIESLVWARTEDVVYTADFSGSIVSWIV